MKKKDACLYKWKTSEPKEITWGDFHVKVENQRDNYKPRDVNSC